MKNFEINYSKEALNDLRNIYSYIALNLKESNIAKNLVSLIRKEIKDLKDAPKMYSEVNLEPWKSLGMRHFPVKNYNVFYLVNPTENTVNIVRIFYSGRDVESLIYNE